MGLAINSVKFAGKSGEQLPCDWNATLSEKTRALCDSRMLQMLCNGQDFNTTTP